MNRGAVVFERYELHEQIGAGATGVVWRATHLLLHQTVALKRISFATLSGAQAQLTRDRALREARLAAQLQGHPNVVTVYDVLVDHGDIWLVMEYVPSRSLREILDSHGPMDAAQVARIGAQIANALAAAHAHNIEHRDVKPGNILIGHDGTIKLTDFGISHLTGDPHLTQTGISGTPAYLAPEVAGNGESSPASDVFSLGSTLYTALEGQPPFGTDDNTFRLLNIVRNGIIRPPTCAGPLEPLLLRLLQLNPATRPDAATTRDLLTQLGDPASGDGSARHRPTPRRPRRWWPPRRRTALTAGALLAVATVVGVLIGASMFTGILEPAQPPSTAALPTDTGDQRQADPCALINLDSLRQFGEPQFATAPFLEGCLAIITASGNVETYLQVILYRPGESASELGESRQVSGVPVVRKDREGVQGGTGCQDSLAPPGRPGATITVFPYRDGSEDLCTVTEVATAVAAEVIARNGGIPAKLNRNPNYSLALADACTILDNTTLTKIPGLDPSEPSPGFANWSCFWGTADNATRVELRFGLRQSFDGLVGEPVTIAGKQAYRVRYSGGCDVYVAHRPAAAVAETFTVTVSTSLPDDACDRAADLATAAEEELRRNQRNADPCALINPDSLLPFGEPQLAPGYWLQGCQANIETTNGDDIELRVMFENPVPASDFKVQPQQVGEMTLIRRGILPYWGQETCRNHLILGADQPMITINAVTDDEPVDLCAMTEAATTAAVEALERDGGITYDPDRIAVYSHAHSDACALLDYATLTTVPGLDPDDPSTGYSDRACRWHTAEDDEAAAALILRLEESVLPSFYEKEYQRITIAEKVAFLDRSESQRCDALVIHRSTSIATELIEVQIEAPLTTDELCTLAVNFATAAEEQLPGS